MSLDSLSLVEGVETQEVLVTGFGDPSTGGTVEGYTTVLVETSIREGEGGDRTFEGRPRRLLVEIHSL